MHHPYVRTSLALAAVGLALAATWSFAGPLTPPAGSVTSTYKTLTEVEPRIAINATNTPGDANSLFKITQPGSYYLTGNITGVAGKHGIEIVASGVTLDLNGFDLVGVAGMGTFDGIITSVSSLSGITVRNGSVRNWGDAGIAIGNLSPRSCRIENIVASGNATNGISGGPACVITGCTSSANGGIGISLVSAGVVTHCASFSNVTGISVGQGCTVSDCTVNANSAIGISAGFAATITNCTAYANVGTGINAAGFGGTITNCSCYQNSANGIEAGSGCTVTGCTTRINTLDGILCTSSCLIRDNNCTLNGLSTGDGANIHATSADNRIEGNNCIGADRGIDVDSTGNIIVRNTCSGNTNNWDVIAGNIVLVVNATTATAVTGNAGGAAPGSTDPNANFTY